MRSSTRPSTPEIARARPLLGTIVTIRCSGGHAAIDAAFAEIAAIHALMSYQAPDSDLARINRAAHVRAVAVDPRTARCLSHALDLAGRSGGVFDPCRARGPAAASWRDVEIVDGRVRFHAPLAIDLSGIAKGDAIDRAVAVLQEHGATAGLVEAGGDLRVFGAVEERVALRPAAAAAPAMVIVADAALASSDPRTARDEGTAPHRDGRTGAIVADRFVSIVAPRCIDADALTKVVLAAGDASAPILAELGATAHVHDEAGWRSFGADAMAVA